MTRRAASAMFLVLALAVLGCRKPPEEQGRFSSRADVPADVQRCAHRGASAVEDSYCRKVRDETFDRFIGKERAR